MDITTKIIAVLLTCHNRRDKTLACLRSLHICSLPKGVQINVFLVDDGSSDGTGEAVKQQFPTVKVIQGDGNLFWAGGMRLAWSSAIEDKAFDGYLLLNDDTILDPNVFSQLGDVHNYSIEHFKTGGIYAGSTCDPFDRKLTYGGHLITNKISGRSINVKPNHNIQMVDFANANILFVTRNVVEKIGILSKRYTHFLADFDYTYTAKKLGFPILICKDFCGYCENDHMKNWLSAEYPLKERINYLKSPKHLAYGEYLYYVGKHFPFYWPVSFVKLWLKTLFPVFYDKFK